MKKNVMLPIWILTIAFCFYVESPVVSAQDHGTTTPKPTQTKPPTQTETTTTPETQEVVFGAFKSYTHSSGWFSMSVPGNWTINDKSVENELIISLADPTGNAVFIVRVWLRQSRMTEDEMTSLLRKFLTDRMSDFQNFSMGDPKTQKDGSIGMYFKYDAVVNMKAYPMYGDTFIEQKGRMVGLSSFIMPKDQYDKKKDDTYKMINSVRINPNSTY